MPPQKNRVPTARELASLRLIAEIKSTYREKIENDLSKLQATYDEINIRYAAQTLVLESIQSEMSQTKHFMATLEDQRRALDEEIDEFRGLLHPIRRYPTDVLKIVFEMTLSPPRMFKGIIFHRSRHWQATTLSHVCQHWRQIALSTPSFWTEVQVPFELSLEDIKASWKLSVERVKSAPAFVFLSDVGRITHHRGSTHINMRERQLRICNLEEIPVISALSLSIATGLPPSTALTRLPSFPVGRLDSLIITGSVQMPPGPLEDSWCWVSFLHRFPPLHRLELRKLTIFQPNPSASLPEVPTVKELNLSHIYDVPLVDFLRLFPNITHLEIYCLGLGHSPNHSECVLLHLVSLKVSYSRSFPWVGPFKSPNLLSLEVGETPEDRVIAFVAQCRYLRKAFLEMSPSLLSEYALAAPLLEELHLKASDEFAGPPYLEWLAEGSFPRINRLEIDFDDAVGLSLSAFESLVERRCLPAAHQASRRFCENIEPLRTLLIREDEGCMTLGNWRESKYLTEASIHEQAYDSDDDAHETTLSWL